MLFESDPESLQLFLVATYSEPQDLDDGRGRDAMQIAVDEMVGCFYRQAGPNGERWPALRDSTLRQRGRRGGSTIGVASGTLLSAIKSGDIREEPGRVTWTIDDRGFARGHSLHNGNERVGAPPRPWLGWTPEAIARVNRLYGLG